MARILFLIEFPQQVMNNLRQALLEALAKGGLEDSEDDIKPLLCCQGEILQDLAKILRHLLVQLTGEAIREERGGDFLNFHLEMRDTQRLFDRRARRLVGSRGRSADITDKRSDGRIEEALRATLFLLPERYRLSLLVVVAEDCHDGVLHVVSEDRIFAREVLQNQIAEILQL
jgi:hypothetical protein